jgi:hypothetical protein
VFAGFADFGGYNAPVLSRQTVGDEEGIAPDFFELVIGEIWCIPVIDHILHERGINVFSKDKGGLVIVHPVQQWVIVLSSGKHLFEHFLWEFDRP